MSEWKEDKLGSLFILKNDKSKQLNTTAYEQTGLYPIIDQSTVFICGYSNDQAKLNSTNLPVTIFGDHTRHVKYVDFPFIAGADGTQILKSIYLVDKFLYYLVLFSSERIGNYGYDRHLKHLKEFRIKYPQDKVQQRKIASILSTIDSVIEKTQSAIDKYKAIKQGMLHDLFTRGIDIKTGKLRPKYEDAPELYKPSKLGWIPVEWNIDIIEKCGEIVTGSTPSTIRSDYYGDEFLFVSPSDIQEGIFISNTEKRLTRKGFDICRQLPERTICAVCIGSTIGKIALLIKEGCTNQQINSVICFNRELSFYYFYAMLYYNEKQFRKETGLQAVPIVNKHNFSKFVLPIIEKNEAIEISSRLKTIDNKLHIEQISLYKLQMLKSGLMSDLLSGKKPVKVNDEDIKTA